MAIATTPHANSFIGFFIVFCRRREIRLHEYITQVCPASQRPGRMSFTRIRGGAGFLSGIFGGVPRAVTEGPPSLSSLTDLPFLGQSQLLCPAEAFHRILQAGGGRPVFRCRERDQLGGAVGSDICGPLAGVVNLDAFPNVGRDPCVEAAVRAPEHVNEPRFSGWFWHAGDCSIST